MDDFFDGLFLLMLLIGWFALTTVVTFVYIDIERAVKKYLKRERR